MENAADGHWASKVTHWRFEHQLNSDQVTKFQLPIVHEDSTRSPKDGVINGDQAEGPSLDGATATNNHRQSAPFVENRPGEPASPTPAQQVKTESPFRAAPPLFGAATTAKPSSASSTVPLHVRRRQTQKIRSTKFELSWFSSASDKPIDHPPPLSPDYQVETGDFYVHSWGEQHQTWRCARIDAKADTTWVEVKEMEVLDLGDNKLRQYVVTDGGKPSLVVPGSIDRRYKDKAGKGGLNNEL